MEWGTEGEGRAGAGKPGFVSGMVAHAYDLSTWEDLKMKTSLSYRANSKPV